MKSLTFGAHEALESMMQARANIALAIHVAHEKGIMNELERQWLFDHEMLTKSQPFAWSKETTQAVLAASRSIPTDTQFNSLNLGTEAIWWHFEEKLPWETTTDGVPGIRAICMAPTVDINRRKKRVVLPAGSPMEEFEALMAGTSTLWKETVTQYGISAWIDGPMDRGVEWQSNDGERVKLGKLGIIPSQTFSWVTGDTLQETLDNAAAEHVKVYGPGGVWAGKEIVGQEVFMAAAEGMARFILAGLTWIQQKIIVADVAHIERHARKRVEKELKRKPELRLVQLRRTEYSRPAETSEEDKAKREYNCQWQVDGHWRNQKVGPGRKETKLTWVRPYIKGPDDKPLVVPPKKVYVVAR